ncbi:fumarylacetoacetate hydrolase family protein [Actinocorallia sp. A-T 12471]|uniref:fumarylacetoacetate hydrolase family protein n=1 Tax=Actinocorallia sp. A-T 12471 TaxID=3089813 RepID=UPI0029CBA62B|nr:fumarylacetoacetate hydrolase family protein [Actinocorallia sp. A-T 12471]MDX6740630.1 fumarylacetoacetate hydrolase family protein [Actinocorallia sp. A-T 12471]
MDSSPEAFGIARIELRGRPLLAALRGGGLSPLPALLGDRAPAGFEEALADWDALVDAVADALARPVAAPLKADAATFLPPAVDRPAVWCAGANYHDHVAEMGAEALPDRAFHFLSPPTVLSGHGRQVTAPRGVERLDWEAELAVVIGRTARHVGRDGALDHVAGYTVANDMSVRDPERMRHPFFGIDWTSSKNADGLLPLGPAVVPARFVGDPGSLRLRLDVNGVRRQDADTSLMIVDTASQIAALSSLVTLHPGDLVITGTPAGTAAAHGDAYLRPGDTVTAAITGLGSLTSVIG